METRRWYDPNVPQTLAIAQILLYINGVFALLFGGLGGRGSVLIRLLFLASIAAYIFGAYGIANGKKLGWQVAVVAAFSPFILRFVNTLIALDFLPLSERIRYVIGIGRYGGGLLNAIFDIALIALQLHPMSRNHQKIWFR